MNKHFTKWIWILPIALLQSCSFFGTGVSVETSKAWAESISPEYSNYVESDTVLKDEDKARRHRNVAQWRKVVGLPPLPVPPSLERDNAVLKAQQQAQGGAK